MTKSENKLFLRFQDQTPFLHCLKASADVIPGGSLIMLYIQDIPQPCAVIYDFKILNPKKKCVSQVNQSQISIDNICM